MTVDVKGFKKILVNAYDFGISHSIDDAQGHLSVSATFHAWYLCIR